MLDCPGAVSREAGRQSQEAEAGVMQDWGHVWEGSGWQTPGEAGKAPRQGQEGRSPADRSPVRRALARAAL